MFAIAAPVATAMPSGKYLPGQTGGTPAPQQDERSADAHDVGTTTTTPTGLPTWPVDPKATASSPLSDAAPVAVADDDTSPLAYILPGLFASLLLAAGMAMPCACPGAPGARVSAPEPPPNPARPCGRAGVGDSQSGLTLIPGEIRVSIPAARPS